MPKITQQQISDIFGVDQKMVSRWKQQGAPLDDFQALCKWLRLYYRYIRMPEKQ
jgi:phage terminase Nu1 subunit (DNA packaging protein)